MRGVNDSRRRPRTVPGRVRAGQVPRKLAERSRRDLADIWGIAFACGCLFLVVALFVLRRIVFHN